MIDDKVGKHSLDTYMVYWVYIICQCFPYFISNPHVTLQIRFADCIYKQDWSSGKLSTGVKIMQPVSYESGFKPRAPVTLLPNPMRAQNWGPGARTPTALWWLCLAFPPPASPLLLSPLSWWYSCGILECQNWTLKHRGGKWLAQGHTAIPWESQG